MTMSIRFVAPTVPATTNNSVKARQSWRKRVESFMTAEERQEANNHVYKGLYRLFIRKAREENLLPGETAKAWKQSELLAKV